jgi:hypothetical protein
MRGKWRRRCGFLIDIELSVFVELWLTKAMEPMELAESVEPVGDLRDVGDEPRRSFTVRAQRRNRSKGVVLAARLNRMNSAPVNKSQAKRVHSGVD